MPKPSFSRRFKALKEGFWGGQNRLPIAYPAKGSRVRFTRAEAN